MGDRLGIPSVVSFLLLPRLKQRYEVDDRLDAFFYSQEGNQTCKLCRLAHCAHRHVIINHLAINLL